MHVKIKVAREITRAQPSTLDKPEWPAMNCAQTSLDDKAAHSSDEIANRKVKSDQRTSGDRFAERRIAHQNDDLRTQLRLSKAYDVPQCASG